MSVSWAWWTLNSTQHEPRQEPLERRTPPPTGLPDWSLANPNPNPNPPPTGLSEWSLAEEDAVVLFGSAAHDMRYGTVRGYAHALARLVAQLERRTVRAKLVWLVGAANHVYDDHLECSEAEAVPTHRMSFHRSMLFAAMGAEAFEGVAPQLDMWRLTADQSERCARVHYDELYVQRDGGGVSRSVANALLNLACNRRVLPDSELD